MAFFKVISHHLLYYSSRTFMVTLTFVLPINTLPHKNIIHVCAVFKYIGSKCGFHNPVSNKY